MVVGMKYKSVKSEILGECFFYFQLFWRKCDDIFWSSHLFIFFFLRWIGISYFGFLFHA